MTQAWSALQSAALREKHATALSQQLSSMHASHAGVGNVTASCSLHSPLLSGATPPSFESSVCDAGAVGSGLLDCDEHATESEIAVTTRATRLLAMRTPMERAWHLLAAEALGVCVCHDHVTAVLGSAGRTECARARLSAQSFS
jgi:hypothetical protein